MSLPPAEEALASAKPHQDTMPRLDMELNSNVYIKINPLAKDVRPLLGEFLGISHYEFLILRVPFVSGLLPRLLPRTLVEIRFIQDGAVHSFRTELISYSLKPSLLLFTSYPDRLSILEMRRHMRNACALPLFLHTPHGEAMGIISDLSAGGCRIVIEMTGQSTMRKLEVGDPLLLQTVFSADGMAHNGSGVIRNLECTGSRLLVGLSFSADGPGFSTALNEYLELARLLV